MKARRLVFLLALLGGIFFGAAAQTSPQRPAHWAQAVAVVGIQNCFQVSTNLYRGAQPTAAGMKHLEKLGIKTVLNLRALHSDQDELAGTALKPVRLKMEPWHSDEDEVVLFLKAATDTNNWPVFVHCQRGSDRTGTMCAMYRIVVCGWTKEQALAEMKHGGFGFNPTWQNLVEYVEKSDIPSIRRRVGLPEGK